MIGSLRAALRVSERRRPRCIHREKLGVSWIEPQGPIEFRFAGGKVSLHRKVEGELCVGDGVARINLDGAPRGGERRGKGYRRVRAESHRHLECAGQFGPGPGEPGIGRDRFLEQFDGVPVALRPAR